VKKLREKLGAKARVEVLDRREIEKFLIVPGPIGSFVRVKLVFCPINNWH
jgi:hypothetical protein